MAQSIADKPKKRRGRPATGRFPMIGARLPPDLVVRIDQWAKSDDISRSEAMKRLLEQALAAQPKAKNK